MSSACCIDDRNAQRAASGIRGRTQEQRRMAGAEVRLLEGVVVTSGSFGGEGSRWPAKVKGKPVKPVQSAARGLEEHSTPSMRSAQ
jgi:hypothetical protein